MARSDLFAGLPEEFAPPEKAAAHIAQLNTLAEREAYFVRIPRGWHSMIGHFAIRAIAHRIVDMPEKPQRQNALASVPEFWREEVKAVVLSLWQTREIREQYQAELAARRASQRKEAA